MSSSSATSPLVFVGGYTETLAHVRGKASGVGVYRMDPASGALAHAATVDGPANPSYLALHPRLPMLYAVEEVKAGMVSAFRFDPASGAAVLLNRQPSGGSSPAHLCMDRSGNWLLVANYSSGTVAVLPISDDGSLGAATDMVRHAGRSVHPERQVQAHAHCVAVDPANRFALVADLGLDKIMIYHLDAGRGALLPHDPTSADMQPGAGPRHLAFHSSGRWVYVINELDSTLVTCAYDAAAGRLEPLQRVSTLPEGFAGTSTTAAVRVAPSGRFVYGSNRGHDSIVVYAVDPAAGTLTYVEHVSTEGQTPRDFNIDPTGTFLLAANQDSDTITTFRVDPDRGTLSPTGHVIGATIPVCVEFGAAAELPTTMDEGPSTNDAR